MVYRKEIDGLRAIAIIPVLLFHTGFSVLGGGYLGVDVFFVISGFLITTIITEEIKKEKFSLINFYERRARRILPALFTVVLFTAFVLPFITASPKDYQDFGYSLISVVFFVSNFYFFEASGYFGSASEVTPLLHTWSLAVEEQYYIFFPIFCMLFFNRSRFLFWSIILLTIVISLLICEWGWRNSPVGNFYLIPSRAWELLLGSLASILITTNFVSSLNNKIKGLLSLFGLVLIIVSYFTFSSETPHPSLLTIIPVFGTFLIILFSSSDNICGKILSNVVFVHIGLISYSLYLWHQPVLAFAKIETSIHLPLLWQVLSLIFVYFASIFSYKYIERPFRSKQKFNRPQIFKYSAAAMSIMFVVGLSLSFNTSLQKLVIPESMARYEVISKAHRDHSDQYMHQDNCNFWSGDFDEAFKNKFDRCAQDGQKAIFVIGGSHGMDLYNAIAINSEYEFIVSISKGFCRAHKFMGNKIDTPRCYFDELLEFFKSRSENIKLVVYSQTPDKLFKTKLRYYDAQESDLSPELVGQVVNYLGRIKTEAGVEVLMHGMLPLLYTSPINLDHRKELEPQLEANIPPNSFALTQFIDKTFTEQLRPLGIGYLPKISSFELNYPSDLMIDGEITYSDSRHISLAGEKAFGKRLVKHMITKGYLEK